MKKSSLLLCSLLATGILSFGIVSCNRKENSQFEGEIQTIILSKISDACKIANENPTKPSDDLYELKGILKRFININKGILVIEDEMSGINVSTKGSYDDLKTKPQIGETLTIKGNLTLIDGNPTLVNAEIITAEAYVAQKDEKDHIICPISYARTLPENELVNVTGVVASIYNNGAGSKANIILVDESGAINVYSESVANTVVIGNTINIRAKRSNYISSKEIDYAKKWGYEGTIQLKDAELISRENLISDFDTGWIKNSSMKELINKDPKEKITTSLYKIKGYINKKSGTGFTNYYINDIDGETGSYTYSQNNGKDYAWLDEFDDKLCDIYISPINCKSTSTSCYFRFTPVKVSVTDIALEEEAIPNYIIDYFIKDEIATSYEANPQLVLPTSISDTKLGFENASIKYSSNNLSVINFTEEGENIVLNALNNGEVKIKVEVTYKTYSKTFEIIINVKLKNVENALTVKEALDKEDNTEVIVKGIVNASLLTRRGFYLADDTGTIAVLTKTDDILRDIKIGDEVYMKGIKTHLESSKTEGYLGQICIEDAEVELNAFGRHEINKKAYIKDKTISELTAIPLSSDVTANIYTTTAKVKWTKGYYAVNVILSDPNNPESTLLVYNSNESEVSYIKEFNEKVVTIDLALCNWNRKQEFKVCILSISDGTTTNNCDYFLKK